MAGNFKIFSRVGKTRIIPIGLKILLIFIVLILLSNFATNYISLQLSQRQIINLNNTIMVEQLKELYSNSSNQYQIYTYSGNEDDSNESMRKVAATGFSNPNSVAFGLKEDGSFEFLNCNNELAMWTRFVDKDSLDRLIELNRMESQKVLFRSATMTVNILVFINIRATGNTSLFVQKNVLTLKLTTAEFICIHPF